MAFSETGATRLEAIHTPQDIRKGVYLFPYEAGPMGANGSGPHMAKSGYNL